MDRPGHPVRVCERYRKICAGLLIAAGASILQPAIAVEPAQHPRVDVIVSRTLHAAQAVQAIQSVERAYDMSTGGRMTVASSGTAMRIRYGSQTSAILRHDGNCRYVSNDGLLTLRFEPGESGDPERVRLELPARWQ